MDMTKGLDFLPGSKRIPLHKHCMYVYVCACLSVIEGDMEYQISKWKPSDSLSSRISKLH